MLFALGGVALAFAGIALFGAASQRWTAYVHQNRWPMVQATIRDCRLVSRRGRNSVQTAVVLQCSVEFVDAAGNRVQGGLSARPAYTGAAADALRAWMTQHPIGSTVAVHYNPEWPPQTEPDQPGELFYDSPPLVFLRAAEIAGAAGVVLVALALFLRPAASPT